MVVFVERNMYISLRKIEGYMYSLERTNKNLLDNELRKIHVVKVIALFIVHEYDN